MLKYGANVHSKAAYGTTPLHVAAFNNNVEGVSLLLASGADSNCKDDNGSTPLHDAAFSGCEEIIRILLSYRADCNCRNNEGLTLLHRAAYFGRENIVSLLLANGADVNSKDNSGKTPLDIAVEKGHHNFVKLLKNVVNEREREIKEQLERESREQVEKETRERENRERVERDIREIRDKVERETIARVEGETRQRIEQERAAEVKRLLDQIEQLKLEKQQSQASHEHVFLSIPDMQQLPSYLNAGTLEVGVSEYSMDPSEIGAGGFAVVYKGVHTASKREVVIKKIRGAAANSNNEKMFAKEMSKIRFLAHPGIPKVEAFYRLEIDICLVFQESNGRSVRSVMDENERSRKVPQTVPSLLPFDVVRLTVRLIEILDYVHSIGVVHYDIKPENVLLCSSDNGVQLIDFGSAGFVSNTAKTANTSTPSYSPPEKLDPLAFDDVKSNKRGMSKLDVWSLGATILNACCGALLLTDEYEENDDLRPYFSITSLVRGVIKLDDHKIPWDLDLVLSKYFEACSEAKAVWDAVDGDVKDIITACLTHDISKRPFTRDIAQMQSFQRLRNKM